MRPDPGRNIGKNGIRERSDRPGLAAPLAAPDLQVLVGRGTRGTARGQRPNAAPRRRPLRASSGIRSTRFPARTAATGSRRARTYRRSCSTMTKQSRSRSDCVPPRAHRSKASKRHQSRTLAKLEQVLPDRLRRHVNAVHSNVSSLRWNGNSPTVDADALAVLALACRDNEQVRFDYRRHDGEEARDSSSRTTSFPRDDVGISSVGTCGATTGARFVSTDSRHRTSAVCVSSLGLCPRTTRPRSSRHLSATCRFAFVATVVVDGPLAEVRELIRQADSESVAVDDAHTRVHFRADNQTWLLMLITALAANYDVAIEEPRRSRRSSNETFNSSAPSAHTPLNAAGSADLQRCVIGGSDADAGHFAR